MLHCQDMCYPKNETSEHFALKMRMSLAIASDIQVWVGMDNVLW